MGSDGVVEGLDALLAPIRTDGNRRVHGGLRARFEIALTPAAPSGRHVALLGYRFVARGPELRIEHEFVEPVVVRLEPFAFAVTPPTAARAELLPGAEPRSAVRFELSEVEQTAEHVLGAIAARRRRRVPALPLPIVQGHLLATRSRGLERLNPEAHRVQRAVLAVDRHVPRLAYERAFYQDPFLARDVMNHRAAACALVTLEARLLRPWCARRGRPSQPTVDTMLDAMREWRALFSITGRPYRSLNRTLMNLPEGVGAHLLPNLSSFELERPLTGRFALTAVLLHVADGRAARLAETALCQRKILERAQESEIADAVQQVGRFTNRALRVDRPDDLAFTIRFLIDDPHPFQGRLQGLVHRSIRWHRHLRTVARRAPRRAPEAATGRVSERPDGDAPDPPPRYRQGTRFERRTALPPIPLPRIPGVEFLDTVGRIHTEAHRMDNCIASYAPAAVAGDCYLFHVSHGGQEASVEIAPSGYVRQAEGPSNSSNDAARWGAERLREWSADLHRPERPARPAFVRRRPPPPNQLELWGEGRGPR